MSAAHGAKARLTYLRGESMFVVQFPKYDEWAVAEIKRQIPAESRSYDPTNKAWYVHRGWDQVVADILRAAFGDVTIEHEGQAWSAPEPIRKSDPSYAELFLMPGAPPELVQCAYRILAKRLHPDAGGTDAAMTRVNLAFESLRKAGAA